MVLHPTLWYSTPFYGTHHVLWYYTPLSIWYSTPLWYYTHFHMVLHPYMVPTLYYGTTPLSPWYSTSSTVLHPIFLWFFLWYSTPSFFGSTPPLAMVLHPTLYSTPPLLRYSTHLSIWHFMPPYGSAPPSPYGTPTPLFMVLYPPLAMVLLPLPIVLHPFSLWYFIPLFYGTLPLLPMVLYPFLWYSIWYSNPSMLVHPLP